MCLIVAARDDVTAGDKIGFLPGDKKPEFRLRKSGICQYRTRKTSVRRRVVGKASPALPSYRSNVGSTSGRRAELKSQPQAHSHLCTSRTMQTYNSVPDAAVKTTSTGRRVVLAAALSFCLGAIAATAGAPASP